MKTIVDKPKETKNLNDIYLLKEENKSENIDDIIPNTKLESFYLNLLNNCEITLPKINGFQHYLAILDNFLNKLNIEKDTDDQLLRKKELLKVLIEELEIYTKDINEQSNQEKLMKYFLNKNFFNIFLEILNEKKDISSFNKIFLLLSKVRIFNF